MHKADLVLVASLFHVNMPLNARKVDIIQCLIAKLMEKGIVKPVREAVSAVAIEEVGAEAAMASETVSDQVKV